MLPAGLQFYKMSGSGNDFVIVDASREPAPGLLEPATVQAVCARATGIGADGIVLLEASRDADFRMTYLNSDGSRADLCGNASLCSTRLAVELGIVDAGRREFRMATDAGVLSVRMLDSGPEVDLPPVTVVRPRLPLERVRGEEWIGYAVAGVPHLVVRTDDVEAVDLMGRGRPLRFHESLQDGANVNFVSPGGLSGWRMRTYERGVEGETLACGTGAVSTAVLLAESGEIEHSVALVTKSGRILTVRLRQEGGIWYPSLAGEARIVFAGVFGELDA